MLPIKLYLKNYLTYEEAEIDFTNIRKALILGIRNNNASISCGSGKSNLLRAIPWCLWGVNPEAETLDQNVRWGADFCSVKFEFKHHGQLITVERTRSPKTNKSTLDLTIDGVGSNGTTIADTTLKITTLLNLDYTAYVNSCYIRQNDIYSLANTEDKDASRELFERLMGLTIYEDYYDATEEIFNKLEKDRDEFYNYIQGNANIAKLVEEQQAIVSNNGNLIKEKEAFIANTRTKIKADQERYDTLKVGLSSKEAVVREYKEAKANLLRSRNELVDLKTKAEQSKTEYLNKVNSLTDQISQLDLVQKQLKEWNQKGVVSEQTKESIASLDAKLKIKQAEVAAAQQTSNELENRIGILKHDGKRIRSESEAVTEKINNPNIAIGSKCDKCLTDITEVTLDHYVGHLNADIALKNTELEKIRAQIMDLNPKKNDATQKISDLSNEISTIAVDQASLRKLVVDDVSVNSMKKHLQKQLDDIAARTEELSKLDYATHMKPWLDTIDQKVANITTLNAAVTNLEASVDATYEEQHQNILSIMDSIEFDNRRINGWTGEISMLEVNISTAQSRIKDFDIIKQEITESEERLQKIERDLAIYKDLLVAFSPKGIRYHILGKAIEELEREANQILPKLSHGNLKVSFQTKKEIKKSKRGQQEKLVFDAFIHDGEKVMPFSTYSGGEQFMISFVIRVALSNLLLKRANADLQFMVIDEAISPLDQAGIEMIIPAINELQNYFKVILVITHRTEVKQYFDEIITIKRNKYVSSIEV